MLQSPSEPGLGVGNGWNWGGVGNCELVTEVIMEFPFRSSEKKDNQTSAQPFHVHVVDSDFAMSHFEDCFKSARSCR